MKKKGIVIVLLIFMISVLMEPISTTYALVNVDSDLTKRLEKKIIPLETVEAVNGFKDMNKLKKLLIDKEIIGMGEATHGTREFIQMKHRMFEFLVQEMGYRVFVIEADFGGSQKVNEYILYNIGSLEEAIRGMKFWTWSTEAVADMITWMKAFNDNQDDENKKIRFYGMDMQFSDNSIEYINEYIGKVEDKPDELKVVLKSLSDIMNSKNLREELEKAKENLNSIKERVEENKEEYIDKSSQEEYDIILQHLNVIDQNIKINDNSDGLAYGVKRDKYMAENVKWIQNFEKNRGYDKLMIWAHNMHITKQSDIYVRMGEHLYDYYGDKYYAVAFDFFRGEFRAVERSKDSEGEMKYGINNCFREQDRNRALALEFRKLNSNLFILDFKEALKDEVIDGWFSESKYINKIGASFKKSAFNTLYQQGITPIKTYDAIIFVEETTASIAYDEASYTKSYELKNEENNRGNVQKKIIFISALIIIVLLVIVFIVVKKNKEKEIN